MDARRDGDVELRDLIRGEKHDALIVLKNTKEDCSRLVAMSGGRRVCCLEVENYLRRVRSSRSNFQVLERGSPGTRRLRLYDSNQFSGHLTAFL